MPDRCRWYVSARAVREWAALACPQADLDQDEGWREAERSLMDVVERAHHLRDQTNGLQLWRGPRPHRVRLIVSTEDRPEGDLPQLVSVLPGGMTGSCGPRA